MRTVVFARCRGARVVVATWLVAMAVVTPLAAQTPAPSPAGPRAGASASAPVAPAPRVMSLLASGTMDMRWATSPEMVIAAPPAFDGTSAYVTTRDGVVVALDLETGAERWRATAATPFTPSVGGDLVYVVVPGSVRALKASTGALAWERPTPGTVAAPPYWDTGWLILSFEGGDLAAFRAADGDMLWRVPLGAVAHVAPVPGLDNLYLGLADGRTVALALATGATLWTQPLDGRASGLTALDDQLLVGTTAGALVSLDLRTGRLRWRVRTGAGVVAAPAADERRIFVVAFDHVLRALDRRHGNLRWKVALPHRPAAGPMVAGGTVLVPVFATELQGFDAATGKPSLTMTSASEVSGAMRVRVGGGAAGTRLTAVSTEGQLIAFGPRIEPAPVRLETLPGVAVPEPPPPPQAPPSGAPLVR